jgi:hypothetical protein
LLRSWFDPPDRFARKQDFYAKPRRFGSEIPQVKRDQGVRENVIVSRAQPTRNAGNPAGNPELRSGSYGWRRSIRELFPDD